MKRLLVLLFFVSSMSFASAQEQTLEELLNYPVGGIWTSLNDQNDHRPEGFKQFFMDFHNGLNLESVYGLIGGVRNNGDTVLLTEIWNFVNPADSNIFFVQRASWGETSVGTIKPHEGKHLDIQFRSTMADGRTYYTKDIHYIDGPNTMRAVTFQKMKEEEDWREVHRSLWTRTEK